MSKKYRDKLCVYCAAAMATGADHVFARKFFLPSDRASLPKVPACAACNGAKSQLEHYAVSVLPFGGQHGSARENLSMVPARLSRNAPLHRTLSDGRGQSWAMNVTGLLAPRMTIPVEGARLIHLFELTAKGLLWHHWQTYLSAADSVSATMLTRTGEQYFEEIFRMQSGDHVSANLGNGTVRYEGVQGVDCPQLSVWRITMFGGVWLGDSKARSAVSSVVGLITGPTAVEGGHVAIDAENQRPG